MSIKNILDSFFSLLTFPGIIIHEISHRIFCDLMKIPVYKICYFSLSSTDGPSVTYRRTYRLKTTFFINIGPLFINTLLCIFFTLPYQLMVKHEIPIYYKAICFILAWLGYSIGVHAIPSAHDIKNITNVFDKRKNSPIYISFFVYLIRLITPLRKFGFEVIYSYLIAKLVPSLLNCF